MNVLDARGMLCEEFRVEGCEITVFRKDCGKFGVNDLGNSGGKWRGDVCEGVTQADKLFVSGGVRRRDGVCSQKATESEKVLF